LSLLAIGFALHGIAYLPYAMQLAHGWVSLLLRLNAAALVLLIPAAIVGVIRVGPIGAATAWVILNAGYVVVGASIMHTRLLRGEQWRWYGVDLASPLAAALLVTVPARVWLPQPSTPLLAVIAMGTLAAALLSRRAVLAEKGPRP
jgi:O-antigen/teichoic acid export membrane protein